MKKIDRLIYQEILPPAIIALLVLTFVVFTRDFGRLAETLIRKNADALTVFQVVLFLLPKILIFTIPLSFLIGTLIGFSRLSTESEIVAMRANGIGIYQILKPVFRIGLAFGLLTLTVTLYLLPMGNWNLRRLRHQIGMRPVLSQIKPRVFNEDIPGKLLYVEDVELGSGAWKGVFLADNTEQGQKRIILAREGLLLFSPDGQRLQLSFGSAANYEFDPADPAKNSLSQFGSLSVTVELPEAEAPAETPKNSSDKEIGELLQDLRQALPETQRRSRVELHRRMALPLSVLIFGIIGVTFGITTHRGGRGYGAIVSLIISFSYYVLFATGARMAGQGIISIWSGVWGANLLLGSIALTSLYYARRGKSLTSSLQNNPLLVALTRKAHRIFRGLTGLYGNAVSRARSWLWGLSPVRLGLTRVIDSYLIRIFLFNFCLTLLVCVSLFYLFTFFELIDDLFANEGSYSTLTEYFVYLLPHVLMLIIPISILIATLVTFGLLEKTFQVVAFKACGVGLYRLTIPVVGTAVVVSAAIFIIGEYVLPYANQRQENLLNVLKGRPVQTYYQPGRNWIFGKGDRLYNYSYFDADRNLFAELSVYEIDIGRSRLISHVHARRAQWDRSTQTWRLVNGWTRELGPEEGFSSFDRLELPLPEKPDYFVQEVKQSSKMTYLELGQYIEELQQGGFEVDHLRTELHKKISFPAVSFIMVILGIPFSFSIGRKGALYGIAAGIFLGIGYWGAFGAFGVLGNHGLLSPLLAAWGPNLLFGSGSVLLLLSVRT